ncbi:stage V sporulation protein S [Paenibacillus macerans]|uniref:stage V sporulation protein S n=1 Tax=Paenibacillus macerans TaxID=44252 RepID=UPI001B0EC85E|nr:stage V sporulation protein S [Paenibacillus macerans]GIP08169.1 stage V sporulation protein S [Paenibacillus macerans]
MPSIRRVSAQVDPNDAARWIVGAIEKCGVIELQAVGDNAISRAVKAVAIAKNLIAANRDMFCTPSFMVANVKGEKTSGMKLVVENR